MADLSGTIVVSCIKPTSSVDTYPTHEDQYGLGGYMCVADVATRNAIPTARRKELMLCGVQDVDTIYCLVGGTDNANWQELWVLSPATFSLLTEAGDYILFEDGTGARLES